MDKAYYLDWVAACDDEDELEAALMYAKHDVDVSDDDYRDCSHAAAVRWEVLYG